MSAKQGERGRYSRDLPTNVILIEFPDRNSALGFFDDPDYQPLRSLRRDGSTSEFTLFPAEDLALMKPPSRLGT